MTEAQSLQKLSIAKLCDELIVSYKLKERVHTFLIKHLFDLCSKYKARLPLDQITYCKIDNDYYCFKFVDICCRKRLIQLTFVPPMKLKYLTIRICVCRF